MNRISPLLLLLILPLISWANPIEHVEPPSWWIGMQEPTLQVLVHGEGLAHYQPRVDHAGVTLRTIHRPQSDNYLFLDLEISPDAAPGSVAIEFHKDGKPQFTQAYELRARQPGSASREGFDGSDVIYLLMPDRFANGNPDNDTVDGLGDPHDRSEPYGRHGGDLQGIIDHLDYLQEMGFTQLWLNPVVANAMPAFSYHGYAATDFYQVDPRLGDNDLYLELSARARERGIGLIQDVVLNHVGRAHYWVEDPPFDDWINHGGKFSPTNHRREVLHDPYASEIDKRGFADGWFVEDMPDLNQRNPYLASNLIQNTIWWIEYAGLSGLRVDTYPYPDRQFLSEWSLRIAAEYPNLNVTGEEWTNAVPLLAYWQRGAPRYDAEFESGLPSLLDFPLQEAIWSGLTEPTGWHTGWMRVYETLASDFLYADAYNLV
ncbi:MAG: alpha-amylase family glycosyl hydrolase, partial [Xanthomonadales bacterium]|nr:alpha-amylase family glycosyl hydrolase [Xanthomonadales bacterium]